MLTSPAADAHGDDRAGRDDADHDRRPPTAARRRATTTSLDASEVSDGATWLGRVLSTLGLAVLFGSLVLIVAAWPEGPEYILAVRFLRSVWLLTLVGTLLYVVALSAAVQRRVVRQRAQPGGLARPARRRVGRAGPRIARLVLVVACVWVVLRPSG